MTNDDHQPPHVAGPVTADVGAAGAAAGISSEDLAGFLAASGLASVPAPPPQSKSALRTKLLIAAFIGVAGLGASVMSCVGQSFSYRQARALEGIEQQLKDFRARCGALPVEHAKSP